MSIVIDSSVTLAWIYDEELTIPLQEVFDLVSSGGAWVPSLWRLKVANALEMGVRRGRTDSSFRDLALADLASLPIQIDPETDRQAWGATLRIAERRKLTLYDAAYLELAQRRGLPIATLDAELKAAALAENVSALGT